MQERVQNISPIKRRILSYAETLGISKRAFYDTIGVSRGTLEAPTGITEEVLAKFIAAYPTVSVIWLVTGEGEMRIDQPLTDDQLVGIPLLPLNALSGGDGHELYNVPAIGEADFLTTVAGSMMSPTLLSGDIIACRRMPSDGIIQWGKIYIVDVGQGQPLIRRIRPGSSADAVILASDNPSYDPIDLPRSSIVSLALVIGFIRVD